MKYSNVLEILNITFGESTKSKTSSYAVCGLENIEDYEHHERHST